MIGRYYAMDRDKRWERVKVAYDALVNGIGEHASDMVEAVQKSYDEGVTDEFIKPVVRIDANGQPVGTIRPNDVVIFFNYRNDRAKELTVVLTQEDMPAEGMHTMPLYYCCMTPLRRQVHGPAHPLRQGECTQHHRRVRLEAGPAGSCASPRPRNTPT